MRINLILEFMTPSLGLSQCGKYVSGIEGLSAAAAVVAALVFVITTLIEGV
jgi:hypothetical protein